MPAGGEAEPEVRRLRKVRAPFLCLLEVDPLQGTRRSKRERAAVAPERAPLLELRFAFLRYNAPGSLHLGVRQDGRAMPRSLCIPRNRRVPQVDRTPCSFGRPVAHAG